MMCELSKLTNQKVYRELVYWHEVFKKMITGSSSFPPFSLSSPPPFRPLALSFARLSRSLEQANFVKRQLISLFHCNCKNSSFFDEGEIVSFTLINTDLFNKEYYSWCVRTKHPKLSFKAR